MASLETVKASIAPGGEWQSYTTSVGYSSGPCDHAGDRGPAPAPALALALALAIARR